MNEEELNTLKRIANSLELIANSLNIITNTMNQPMTLKFENQYYIAGHYNFIINVAYDDNDSEQEIKRRYNEILSLYKTLLLKVPG